VTDERHCVGNSSLLICLQPLPEGEEVKFNEVVVGKFLKEVAGDRENITVATKYYPGLHGEQLVAIPDPTCHYQSYAMTAQLPSPLLHAYFVVATADAEHDAHELSNGCRVEHVRTQLLKEDKGAGRAGVSPSCSRLKLIAGLHVSVHPICRWRLPKGGSAESGGRFVRAIGTAVRGHLLLASFA